MSFKIIRNDITKVSADAIVNTANPRPVFASGTDSAIYKAAGAEALLEARKKIGDIEVGQAAVTPAFDLDAKYIIHTVGPVWIDGNYGEKDAIRSCYENSLKLAKEYGCESIAFPLISTGVYGFPKADALQIAISVFSSFLSDNDMQITLVVFDEDSFALSGRIFSGVDAFIDENYVSEKLDAEYGPRSSLFSSALFGGRRRERRDEREYPGSVAMECSQAMPEESFPDLAEKCSEAVEEEAVEEEAAEVPVPAAAEKKAGRSLDELMSQVSESWQQSLFRIIDEKGYTDTEVYKRANIDRKLFSKIRSNNAYQPKKITAVAFALALKLSLDETKDMLKRAGYALSPSSKFDLIIEYFIGQEVYDTYTINLALFEHDQPLLGE